MKRNVMSMILVLLFLYFMFSSIIRNVTNISYLKDLLATNNNYLSITDMQINQVKNCGKTGSGVKVAMIDSSVSSEEIRLKGTVSLITDNKISDDTITHATISALILKRDIAPNIDLYSIEALNSIGVGTYENIIKGIEWSIENDMDIIAFSFTGHEYSRELHNIIKIASQNDILLIAAAGNYSNDIPVYPAAFQEVIAVGSLDSENMIADYSNFGTYVNIYSPGEMKELKAYGTSFSVPRVVGFIALLLENYDISRRDISDFLIKKSLK